jgi:hypothetical protein
LSNILKRLSEILNISQKWDCHIPQTTRVVVVVTPVDLFSQSRPFHLTRKQTRVNTREY